MQNMETTHFSHLIKKSMRLPFLLITSLFTTMMLAACSQQQEKKEDDRKNIVFFDSIEPSAINQGNNLKIEARFSECGEWGGHKEDIIITLKEDKRFYATYKIFPFNCDSLDYYYANEKIAPVFTKTILLNDTSKKSIINYIQRLMESKITEKFPGHAGNFFSVVNSDSTFFIQVYDRKEFDIKSFKQLITELIK